MTSLGLSGSRNAARGQYRQDIMPWLRLFDGYDSYVTGACVGFDAFAGTYLHWLFPGAAHYVIVPADRSRVDYWFTRYPDVVVEYMPADTDYKARNARIVELADALAAAPEYPEADPRSQRSGTWQTVRMARRKPIEYFPHILNAA